MSNPLRIFVPVKRVVDYGELEKVKAYIEWLNPFLYI